LAESKVPENRKGKTKEHETNPPKAEGEKERKKERKKEGKKHRKESVNGSTSQEDMLTENTRSFSFVFFFAG